MAEEKTEQEVKVVEVQTDKEIKIVGSFSKVLEILANKVSRKAAVIALAMVLIYMLAVTPTVIEITLAIGVITGLAVFFTLLQWVLDKKETKTKLKILARKEPGEVSEEALETDDEE